MRCVSNLASDRVLTTATGRRRSLNGTNVDRMEREQTRHRHHDIAHATVSLLHEDNESARSVIRNFAIQILEILGASAW